MDTVMEASFEPNGHMFLMGHSKDWTKLNICALVSQRSEEAHDIRNDWPILNQPVEQELPFKFPSHAMYPEFYAIDIKQQVRKWLIYNEVAAISFTTITNITQYVYLNI